jgi:hypothetical protein
MPIGPGIQAFLRAIPDAASSPLAFVAYIFTIASWTALSWRVTRYRSMLKQLPLLPENDRLKAMKMELGFIDVPKNLTPADFLRSRIHTFLFAGFCILCLCALAITALALHDAGKLSGTVDLF